MTEEERLRLARALDTPEPELSDDDDDDAPPAPLDAKLEARLVDAAYRARWPGRSEDELAVRRRRRIAYAVVAAFAVAAAALVIPRLVGPRSAMPEYTLRVEGPDRLAGAHDAPTGEPSRLALDAQVRIDLQPTEAVTDTVAARGYVVSRDGRIEPWPVEARPSPQGRLRLEPDARSLPGLAQGAAKLCFTVGRAGKLPGDDRVKALLRESASPSSGSPDWQLRCKDIVVE